MIGIRHHRTSLVFLLCCLLAVLAYLPGLSGDYLFDDNANLLGNKALDISSLDVTELQKAAFSARSGRLRRPVSMASFAVNRYFFGLDPYSYKLINLVIHLLTGLGLLLLTRQIIDTHARLHAHPPPPAVARWLPVIICSIWLVHPINLTSVLYIVQRMTSLSSLFIVCALCLYMAGRSRLLDNRTGLPHMVAGLFVFGGLALFSKETGILLPLYMLVLELTLFRFRTAAGLPDRRVQAFFLACVLLPMAAGLIYLGMHFDKIANYSGRNFSLAERLLTEARVLMFYLKMTVAPAVQQLGLYHDDFEISRGLLSPVTTLPAVLFLGGLLAGGLLLIRRLPLVSLGILWFLAGHTLESTVIPLELAHEHRNYLPVFGIILAIAGLLARLPDTAPARRIAIAAPLLFLVIFTSTTWLRSTQWSSGVDHAVYEARHHPESPRALFAAGRVYARMALQGNSDSADTAQDYFERASRLDPTEILPAVTLIKINHLTGRTVDPALYEEVINRLNRYPVSASDINSLQDLAGCLGKACKVPEPIVDEIFQAALKKENARVLALYGFYSVNTHRDFHRGLDLFERAVERTPREPQYWKNLINLLMVMARFDEAEARLEQFRALQPYGSSENDFRKLQDKIDNARLEFEQSRNTIAESTRP